MFDLLMEMRCAGCAEMEIVHRTRNRRCYTDSVTPRHLPKSKREHEENENENKNKNENDISLNKLMKIDKNSFKSNHSSKKRLINASKIISKIITNKILIYYD